MPQNKKTTLVMDGIQVSNEGRLLTEGLKISGKGYVLSSKNTSDDYTSRVSNNKTATVPPPPTKVK